MKNLEDRLLREKYITAVQRWRGQYRPEQGRQSPLCGVNGDSLYIFRARS